MSAETRASSAARESPSFAVTRYVRPRWLKDARASGWYIPESPGQVHRLIALSRSLASRALPAAPWSLKPSPRSAVTFPRSTSISAIAFASWSVTQARLESSETVMYSGSRSTDGALPAAMTMLGSRVAPSNDVKSTVSTETRLGHSWKSMIDTEPIGSTAPGSPSFATRRNRPFGEKVSMSGKAPTSIVPSRVPPGVKKTTFPGSVRTGASTATARIPNCVSTLFGVPRSETSNSVSLVGAAGFRMSSTSTRFCTALTT